MQSQGIAIVGMACRYPDAITPEELWQNVLAKRQSFRPIPDSRVNAQDYYSPNPAAIDRHNTQYAAVLSDWEFDRKRFNIPASVFRATDLTHWLALETTDNALKDAQFDEYNLPKESTGVIIGNSLTGEFSRANIMRLRWPFVSRTLSKILIEQGMMETQVSQLLNSYENYYKSYFPPVNEDTLAGGLANTIAGRICNYFNLNGGGYIVDGACSSSLLAITTAANALVARQIDIAIAGGVDLSIDPFELIGFAKNGALATERMKVYDALSDGFWPGEGCGILVLMRAEDAQKSHHRIYAVIKGWGVSSDGNGGITRPDAHGHLLAMNRAYSMAGYGFNNVTYMEGHGTGTRVGDETELSVYIQARQLNRAKFPLRLGTIKGNIGHTKAAAGVAGVIKAAQAVYHGMIPPISGNTSAHALVKENSSVLYLPKEIEVWPSETPRRAGISALGFGGINAHITLEQADSTIPFPNLEVFNNVLQDMELFILSAASYSLLIEKLEKIKQIVFVLSFAEFTDLNNQLIVMDADEPVKCAIVAGSPRDLEEKLHFLLKHLEEKVSLIDINRGIFLYQSRQIPRIGFMFPGQGISVNSRCDFFVKRFPIVNNLLTEFYDVISDVDDSLYQAKIVAIELAALSLLQEVGINANTVIGHSLGELSALHWAGSISQKDVILLAISREKAMQKSNIVSGGMLSLFTDAATTENILAKVNRNLMIVVYNSDRQTIVAGTQTDLLYLQNVLSEYKVVSQILNVAYPFHSHLMNPAVSIFSEAIKDISIGLTNREYISTITGKLVMTETDPREILIQQINNPVYFLQAINHIQEDIDLLIEVGPGTTLTNLISQDIPAIAMKIDQESIEGILSIAAASYVLGAKPSLEFLSKNRFHRSMELFQPRKFLANPCESPETILSPMLDVLERNEKIDSAASQSLRMDADKNHTDNVLDTLRKIIAEEVELPLELIQGSTRPLDDLHLSSITIAHIMTLVAQELELSNFSIQKNLALATVADLAESLQNIAPVDSSSIRCEGVKPWVRTFELEWVPYTQSYPLIDALRLEKKDFHAWSTYISEKESILDEFLDRITQYISSGALLCLNTRDDSIIDWQRFTQTCIQGSQSRLISVSLDGFRSSSGVAKTIYLEAGKSVPVSVIELDNISTLKSKMDEILADILTTEEFLEVRYTKNGPACIPRLKEVDQIYAAKVTAEDVIVVSGGAKGITFECARALAIDTGCTLALIGRASIDSDPIVSQVLNLLHSSGIKATYHCADITNQRQVKSTMNDIVEMHGNITGLIHGAGLNIPKNLRHITPKNWYDTIAVKVYGLDNLLSSISPEKLNFICNFGSIIARTGLPGEAHYAMANEWLRRDSEIYAKKFPNIRILTLEWSVWAGAGMGENLGVIETLENDGISSIPIHLGISTFLSVIQSISCGNTSLVITNRADKIDTLQFHKTELPFLRFLERPRIYYSGIELIVESDLSLQTDPYLADHQLQGISLFPAVFGMEAMAQVSYALGLDNSNGYTFENLEFLYPITVPSDQVTTIRIVAIKENDQVHITIRSSETNYSHDHFKGTVSLRQTPSQEIVQLLPDSTPIDVQEYFYKNIMFQGPMFQAVKQYQSIHAYSCQATLKSTHRLWFGNLLSQQLILPDPAIRDASMHALQVCIPHKTLIPTSAAISSYASELPEGKFILQAREKYNTANTYIYDVDIIDMDGHIVIQWINLELATPGNDLSKINWIPELIVSHAERLLVQEKLFKRNNFHLEIRLINSVQLQDENRNNDYKSSTKNSKQKIGKDSTSAITYDHRSESYCKELVVRVLANEPIACLINEVTANSHESWKKTLSEFEYSQVLENCGKYGESMDISATRLKLAYEILSQISLSKTSKFLATSVCDMDPRLLIFTSDQYSVFSFLYSLKESQIILTIGGEKHEIL